jgi:transcriptional accessory protein Tex/SPT6
LAAYLAVTPLPAQQAPKLDLNAARAADLEALPGIGPTTARRIVRLRELNGPYRCVVELRAVPRLTEAQFQTLAGRSYVANPDARCAAQEALRRAGKPVQPGSLD